MTRLHASWLLRVHPSNRITRYNRFLPALDTLGTPEHPISPLLTPNALILIGSNPPIRSRHLSHFHRHVHVAWDINLSSNEGPDSVSTFPTAATDGEGSVHAAQRDIYVPPA
ncbi:hypothetical protein N7474_002258 [Penicillium riverlandense]|uniref:uncharacterized protein n=1 Tax=Penicillium riverlandense TaxID=1903569 RepID=UPI002549821B|nr:uncharacterized protein N7474_002258 [Penicillium riverlandense]KAJ5833947.1 hypothetical protein N7474_002258 [Penicillium riverlandense]